MGAHNSTPQTVRIENPQRGLSLQVTPSVVSRLVGVEDQKQKKLDDTMESQEENQKAHLKYGSVQEVPHNWTQAQDVFLKKYNELEEYQFDKSVERVETMIGKPLAWVEDVNETITRMREELIKCYRDNPKQSLCCANIAKKYQDFIFQEQFNTILKSNEINIK
ncbi:uncharacterized protein LOC119607023 [Lucilia sericata]|uniref:uncharacterized protein LOC119607023 n=1 Tax=Lucilia sericata TaxID=13632 RepID=UPI0018A823A3|nr:uncharacterized protein LOC119607023 [Lucilia sericata]